jgi:hypothetical protein
MVEPGLRTGFLLWTYYEPVRRPGSTYDGCTNYRTTAGNSLPNFFAVAMRPESIGLQPSALGQDFGRHCVPFQHYCCFSP